MKLAGGRAVQRDHVVEPFIGWMRKPRLRGEASHRHALGVARRNIEHGFSGVTPKLAADLPMQRILLLRPGDVLLEHQAGLVGTRSLNAAESGRCCLHQSPR